MEFETSDSVYSTNEIIDRTPAAVDELIDGTRISALNLRRSTGAVGEMIAKTNRYARDPLRLQLQLMKLAFKDDLTGLHNLRGFKILAKRHLRLANTAKRGLLMFFADVDGLKQINDRFGHHEGDRALIRTAIGLKKTFRKSDVTARLSGDEFVALLLEDSEHNAETIIDRLELNLTRCSMKEPRYRLSLSVGVARFDPHAAASLHDLMTQADKALYVQKRNKTVNNAAE